MWNRLLWVALPFSMLTLPAFGQGCWVRDLVTPRVGEVWVLCEEGSVRISADGGHSWQEHSLEPPGGWRALAVARNGSAVAVGSTGRIAWTVDAGKTWHRAEADVAAGRDLYAAAAAGSRFWVAGEEGLVLHSPDGGATWAPQNTYTTARLEGLFFLDEQRGWAVGWAGTILKTTDGGRFWDAVTPEALYENLTAVWFEDPDHGWAVGTPGLLLRTTDGGRTWKRINAGLTGLVHSVRVAGGTGIIAGDRLLVLDAEGRWKPVAWLPPEAFTAASIADGELWAAGPHFVARSRDQGRSWTEVWREPGFPESELSEEYPTTGPAKRSISALRSDNLPGLR